MRPYAGDDGVEDLLGPVVEAGLLGRRTCACRMREHIMGVSVSETTAETRMVTARVMANSRKRRPTTSLMKSSGMSTAMSETVSDMMVKPICSLPLSAARIGRLAFFDVARDVLDHHDGVVHHEAGGDGERHEREVVEAVAQQVHHAEGADDRERHRDRRDDGGGEVAQEEEDDHDDQRDGEHQLEFDVLDRGADGDGAVGEHLDLDDGRQAGLQLRQELVDAVDDGDDVGAGLALNVDDDGGLAIHPRGLLRVFGGVDDGGHVGGADGGAVAIGDDDGLVVGAREQLVVGADGVGLARCR